MFCGWLFRGPLVLFVVEVEEGEVVVVVDRAFLRPRGEGFGGSAVVGASSGDDLGGKSL